MEGCGDGNSFRPWKESDAIPEPVCALCGETIPTGGGVVLQSYDYCQDCGSEMHRELTDVEVTVALVLR